MGSLYDYYRSQPQEQLFADLMAGDPNSLVFKAQQWQALDQTVVELTGEIEAETTRLMNDWEGSGANEFTYRIGLIHQYAQDLHRDIQPLAYSNIPSIQEALAEAQEEARNHADPGDNVDFDEWQRTHTGETANDMNAMNTFNSARHDRLAQIVADLAEKYKARTTAWSDPPVIPSSDMPGMNTYTPIDPAGTTSTNRPNMLQPPNGGPDGPGGPGTPGGPGGDGPPGGTDTMPGDPPPDGGGVDYNDGGPSDNLDYDTTEDHGALLGSGTVMGAPGSMTSSAGISAVHGGGTSMGGVGGTTAAGMAPGALNRSGGLTSSGPGRGGVPAGAGQQGGGPGRSGAMPGRNVSITQQQQGAAGRGRGAGQPGDEEEEAESGTWLTEDDMVWGTDDAAEAAPVVLGEQPDTESDQRPVSVKAEGSDEDAYDPTRAS